MAPNPVRRLLFSSSKTCLKVLKKLATPSSRRRCHPTPEVCVVLPEPVTTLDEPESCSSSTLTVVSWLDEVRDVEDMENRLNEALEMKMAVAR